MGLATPHGCPPAEGAGAWSSLVAPESGARKGFQGPGASASEEPWWSKRGYPSLAHRDSLENMLPRGRESGLGWGWGCLAAVRPGRRVWAEREWTCEGVSACGACEAHVWAPLRPSLIYTVISSDRL